MKNRVFLLSFALVGVLSVALNQQSNPIVSWFSPAATAEAQQATSRTFAGEGGDAARFFFIEKGIKPFQDGVAIDDTPLTTQKICELAGYSRVAYLTTRSFKSCGDNYVETWTGSAWVRSGACSTQPYIDTLTCDTPIVAGADLAVSMSGPSTTAFGNTVTYSTTISNLGPSVATNIVITETIPSGLDWFTATVMNGSGVTCSSTLGTTTCTIPSLNAGQSISYGLNYGFVMSQVCPAPLQTKATVTSATSDSNTSNNTSNTITTNVTNCPAPNTCSQVVFDASYGSLTSQGWTPLDPGQDQSATIIRENGQNGLTYLRISDQSTARGLRTEYTAIPDSALADRDWNLEMKARIISSTPNGYVLGMNMLLTSPGGKYASIYIDTDKFGPIGTSINQYNYARTYSANTTNGFHTYAIKYKKNGAGVNDDTFDVLFDGQVVMSNVSRTEIWDSAQWNQNINGISFGIGSSPGMGTMDVAYVRFQNTDSYNCPTSSSSSSSSSSVSTGGWQCSNGVDDDNDGQSDANDPGCHTDRNRFNSLSYNPYGTEGDNNRSLTCQDGVDNNVNGLVDAQDPICHTDGNPNNNASFNPNWNEGFNGSSSSSSSSSGFAQCNNGYDDDGDSLVDGNDPGCHTDRNRYNGASYNPNGTENGNDRGRGCQDGIDNNGNGLVDAQDPACHSDGNPNNPGTFDPNRNEDGGSGQGNGCIIIKTRAEDDNGDRIDNNDLPSFTVTLDGGQRSEFTQDGDARFNNLSNGSHYVNMLMFGDWEIDSTSPSNGNVTVSGSSCKTVTFNITDTGNDGHHNNGDDAEIDVRKTASSSEVFPGGTVEYVITVKNTGDVDLQDLIVEDRIPNDMTIIDDGDADDRNGNELTWNIDVDEGDTETIRYRVAVPSFTYPGQTIRNDVRVTSDDNDIDIDEDASAFITVIGTLPQTGMTGMVSTASAYLTPIRQAAATSSSSGMGTAAAAATTILSGIGGGIALGRKYLGL